MNSFLFDGLTDEERKLAQDLFGGEQKVQKGGELFCNGSLGLLVSGSAKVKRVNELGGSVTVRNLQKGEMFGCVSVFGNWQEGSSSIIADTNCTCRYIAEQDFEKLLKTVPQTALNYIAYLTNKLRFLNRRLDTFSTDSADQRVYEYLLSAADENGKVVLKISMAELARRLKLGRTSLYRSLNSLENSGMLKREGSVIYIK